MDERPSDEELPDLYEDPDDFDDDRDDEDPEAEDVDDLAPDLAIASVLEPRD